MNSNLFINYAEKGRKRAGLLPSELLRLLCKERCPSLCSVSGEVRHSIDCSIVDLEVLPCCVQRVDCQLIVDSNRSNRVGRHFIRLPRVRVTVRPCRNVPNVCKLLLGCQCGLDPVCRCLALVQWAVA